jgi:hypothetical protein
MPTGNGWYLVGPLIAVGLVAFLGAVFWRMGLQWTIAREQREEYERHERRATYPGRLTIFQDDFPDDAEEDFGLLGTATTTDAPEAADEIRRLLGEAGIRATQAIGPDGRTAVLVFAEELEEARRLVGDTPAL